MPSRWRSRIGALEFGDGADELALERRERVGRSIGCEGEAFLDELDAHLARGEVGDDLLEVDQRSRESIHRRDAQRVTATHVAQRIRQASAIGSALARLMVSEQLIDAPKRFELPSEIL